MRTLVIFLCGAWLGIIGGYAAAEDNYFITAPITVASIIVIIVLCIRGLQL